MKFITLHAPNGSEVDIVAASIVRMRTQDGATCLDLSIGLQIVKETRDEVRKILQGE